ncbi:unnamed protein product [Rhizophagus irregularis]|nr:unnamed protein product [Rhizophagus irregularis]
MDRERRCLEYAIYHREQLDLKRQLNEMDELREKGVHGSNQQNKLFKDDAERITNFKERFDLLNVEKRELDEDVQEQIKAHAQIELALKDMEDTDKQIEKQKKEEKTNLELLRTDIRKKEAELEQIIPSYISEVNQEAQLKEELEDAELKRQALYAKQVMAQQQQANDLESQNKQFNTKH